MVVNRNTINEKYLKRLTEFNSLMIAVILAYRSLITISIFDKLASVGGNLLLQHEVCTKILDAIVFYQIPSIHLH